MKNAPLVYETYWEVFCHFHICAQTTGLRDVGIKKMSWASYLFQVLGAKIGPVSRLTPSTDAEIEERIDASASSHTTESNEDTFNPDMVFESSIIRPGSLYQIGLY